MITMLSAVIDAGFNSFRLSIFQVFPNGTFRNVGSVKSFVRLGEGLKEGDPVPEGKIEEASRALQGFSRVIESKSIKNVTAVGTSAFRFASNGKEVAERLSSSLGHEIRIITGEEEGKFSTIGVMNTLPVVEGLVFDLGGGSLELTLVKDRKIADVKQFPLGALKLSGKPEETIRKEIRSAISSMNLKEGIKVFGSGGNLRAIAKLDIKTKGRMIKSVHGYHISSKVISRYSRLLNSMGVKERAGLPGIDEGRAVTINTGALIVDEILSSVKASGVTISAFGLREGLLMGEEVKSLTQLRRMWLSFFSYSLGLDPSLFTISEDSVEDYVAFLVMNMQVAGFISKYSSCMDILRSTTLPGFSREEIRLMLTLCSVASKGKVKKKFYKLVREQIKKKDLYEKAMKVRTKVREFNPWN
ncbi:Guanosine-5'-triphosphate,3'-diphosphate pyrophosphatase [Sulfuracidifex tepidarius]|uniref:Guanosine-5'-triphosphate,3'-diphosphate pyrophosphatase n=2 Tax=Sulfuracidifex tepidarius TaxID=1294262 RepID=A0A510E1X1_9CREN|nr:Guanosine-5'-triphosphate,3'-diphosphate pyrophosphatase [Sulfuracidifex tepidarius]